MNASLVCSLGQSSTVEINGGIINLSLKNPEPYGLYNEIFLPVFKSLLEKGLTLYLHAFVSKGAAILYSVF